MDRLSVRRFQYLDLAFGMTDGYENVHYLLKDACCAQRAPTRWAAVLVLAEFPDFAPDARRVQFTAETIGRWVFEEYAVLRPLAEAADLLLSEYTDWPMLSNPVRRAENQVPDRRCGVSARSLRPRGALPGDGEQDPRPERMGQQRVRARRAQAGRSGRLRHTRTGRLGGIH